VNWIVFWGVVLYNTMVVAGSFGRLKDWLIQGRRRTARLSTRRSSGTRSWRGSAVMIAWLLSLFILRPRLRQLGEVFRTTLHQIWGALLVGALIFGLAQLFNFSGMAASMADGSARVRRWFIVLAPILGWIGVALSGSNTATNTVFGFFQLQVGRLLGAPLLIFPALNSIGAEVGKPVAPQTASVGVSTTKYVRNEGEAIRHNMSWTLVMLAYLVGIGAFYYFVLPEAMR
jgi:lactate permease